MGRKDDMESLASKPAPPQAGNGKRSPSAANKALITRNLRLAYGEVASEPVPDQLLDILKRLDKAEDGKA